MSVARGHSLASTTSRLPTYTAATRQSTLPTYEQHVDSLSPPERAFIAGQTRLLNGIRDQNPDRKPSHSEVTSYDRDIERLQGLTKGTERPDQPAATPPRPPTANAWRIFFTIVILVAMPAAFATLAGIASDFPYASRCSGRRRATVKGTAIYFGIAVGWLAAWTLMRWWKHSHRLRHARGSTRGFSVFWTCFIWIGYCVVVGYIWSKNVCM